MTSVRSARPNRNEYPDYAAEYVSRVPDGDVVDTLVSQLADTLSLVQGLPESRGDQRYAPGKWSVREVIGHMSDAERVFTYRALRFSRGDATPVPGFDENAYVEHAPFTRVSLADLIDEFEHVRRCSIHLFRNLDDEAMMRRGVANGQEASVRALAFIIAGHADHHVEILRTRYLS